MMQIILTNPTAWVIIMLMKTFKGGVAMKTLRLATYLKQADREYERTKQVLGEQGMKAYKIDYDLILFTLLKKELPFILTYKGKAYEINNADDLERTLLTINY